MRTIRSDAEMQAIERERALVGLYVDRAYNREKIGWLMAAREGFDLHARDAWHLLIPIKNGYGVDTWVQPDEYGTLLAADMIDKLGIRYTALPCIVFSAKEKEYYFLKLGGKSQDQFFEEIGRIADLARECHKDGPKDPEKFRDYVNMQVANHLRRRRLLSATQSALPVLGALLGSAVDITELV